jgi:hypothetical protein
MAENKLFTNLKRLFSTDVIIRNTGNNQLNVIDINKIQQSGEITTNSLVDKFKKIYTNSPTSIQGLRNQENYAMIRSRLYAEYDAMDTDAIIASVLDIIADESTLKNDFGEMLAIKSSNTEIQKTLYNLFYDILNVEFNLWPWIRSMCKYGDFYLKLEIAEKFGIFNVIPYTAFKMERLEGMDLENPHDVKFRHHPNGIESATQQYLPGSLMREDSTNIIFENYEMVHFRLLSDMNFIPYGRAYIEPARKLHKSYVLMEDAMLIHRIVRAPEKRIFYLNIGSIPPNEVENFMQQTITKMKRTPHIDQETGDYNLKYNLNNLLEDFFIPVRGNDATTKIENLNGLQWDGIEDVKYYRDKLFAALKVPKAFMGYDENTDGKATLAAQDIRFARTIERIQSIILSELNKIALIHLYTQGYRDENLVNFELSLTTPSIIYDQERIELLKSKVELAKEMAESKLLPTDWIYENIFRFSEDQYITYRNLMIEDAKRKFRYTQIEEEGNDPKETGKSYGTPHDLATLYGRTKFTGGDVPKGYDENVPLGRPADSITNKNTQDSNFGKDPLGRQGMKKDYNSVGNLNMEAKHMNLIKSLNKLDSKSILIYENKTPTESINSLLDEKNIKDIEN